MSQLVPPTRIGANNPPDYSPMCDGHVLILGNTGSGKTVLLRTIASATTERGGTLHTFDARSGLAPADPNDQAVGHASGLNASANLICAIATEIQRRYEFLDDSGAHSVNDLPASVRPQPVTVVIDDVGALLGITEVGDEHEHSRFRFSLNEVLSLGHGVDVHVAMSAQTLAHVKESEELTSLFGARFELEPWSLQAAA